MERLEPRGSPSACRRRRRRRWWAPRCSSARAGVSATTGASASKYGRDLVGRRRRHEAAAHGAHATLGRRPWDTVPAVTATDLYHVGVLVEDLDAAMARFGEVLGLTFGEPRFDLASTTTPRSISGGDRRRASCGSSTRRGPAVPGAHRGPRPRRLGPPPRRGPAPHRGVAGRLGDRLRRAHAAGIGTEATVTIGGTMIAAYLEPQPVHGTRIELVGPASPAPTPDCGPLDPLPAPDVGYRYRRIDPDRPRPVVRGRRAEAPGLKRGSRSGSNRPSSRLPAHRFAGRGRARGWSPSRASTVGRSTPRVGAVGERDRAVPLGQPLRRRAPSTRGTWAYAGTGRPSSRARWTWRGRRRQQVVAPHDLLDPLRGVVDDDGEVVGGHAVVAAEHDVVDARRVRARAAGRRRQRSTRAGAAAASAGAPAASPGASARPQSGRGRCPGRRLRRAAVRCAAAASRISRRVQ